ncbi:hypothetical protein HMPREF9442_03184 [Paraprevotella xylaniphila YIT 11841]|uniref:Uncharacterized protein n=1 Tax=Paraprevotella xylaniphila YIT 11841 TaxID=762982 RepID=F3QY91_9BACT|nr:hypothetical protein HMPREF9442_03184 [Paraprevotella xylaniphila YIT 11841]
MLSFGLKDEAIFLKTLGRGGYRGHVKVWGGIGFYGVAMFF